MSHTSLGRTFIISCFGSYQFESSFDHDAFVKCMAEEYKDYYWENPHMRQVTIELLMPLAAAAWTISQASLIYATPI